jgi:hypothetical protein
MTYEEAQHELDRLKDLHLHIGYIRERIDYLSGRIEHPGSDIINLFSGRSPEFSVEAKLAKLADLKRDYDKLLAMAVELEEKIIGALSKVDMKYQVILEKYYVKGQRLEEICVDVHYSYPQIKRLKKRAVRLYYEARI